MGYGSFGGAQFIKSEWDGYEAQQRYEDVVVIGEALREWKPLHAVELGTAKGGFSVFLANTLAEWGGSVLSVDIEISVELRTELEGRYKNLKLIGGNALFPDAITVQRLSEFFRGARPFLYCDNGNKIQELCHWVPLLPPAALVGVHDYGTEVDPEEAEDVMRSLGFTPYWHDRFEALAHPEWYPVSLTRLWSRSVVVKVEGSVIPPTWVESAVKRWHEEETEC